MEDKVVEEHVQKHMVVEYEHFPDHDKRVETLEFRSAKNELEKVEHLGCHVCGSMDKRESHHLFERAYANGLDFLKVAHYLYNNYDFHGHCHRDFDSEDELLKYFVDNFNGVQFTYIDDDKIEKVGYDCDDDALDTIYNQLILCKTHHRGESTGIHSESTPSFFAWQARKHGYEPTFTKEEENKFLKEHMKANGLDEKK